MIIAFNDRIVFYSILECKHDDGSDHEDKSHALNLAEQEDRRCQDPFFFFLSVWPHRAAHGISVPQIGIKPVPPTLEVWSPNHWTTREVHAWVLDVILDFLHQPYTS